MARVPNRAIGRIANLALLVVVGASWLSQYAPTYDLYILIGAGMWSSISSLAIFKISANAGSADDGANHGEGAKTQQDCDQKLDPSAKRSEDLPYNIESINIEEEHHDAYWKLIEQLSQQHTGNNRLFLRQRKDFGLTLNVINVYITDSKERQREMAEENIPMSWPGILQKDISEDSTRLQ